MENVDFTNFDFSKVKSISNIFNDCINLKKINISMINALNLINASFAFSGCISLENIFLPDEMILLESTEYMFKGCSNLTSINLEFLKGSSNLKTFEGMFAFCKTLKEINFPNLKGDSLTEMSYMFYGCDKLEIANFEGIKAKNIFSMESMFYGCKNLTYLNINYFDTTKIMNYKYIFVGVQEKHVKVEYDPDKTNKFLENEIKRIRKEY